MSFSERGALLLVCALAGAECGRAPSHGAGAEAPAMEVTYHHAGRAYPAPASVLPRAQVDSMLREMLAGTDDVVRMFVNRERIEMYRERETALEIVFPAESTFHTATRGDVRADRIFLLMSVPDGHSVAIFHGTGAYFMPPLLNLRGREILRRLEPRLQALDPSP
ncbi:MAG TPA: hypothetical protein VFT45_04800 [Longimicrobium sp.]|nr:hypothetical protein [Longimicrobium sp.]